MAGDSAQRAIEAVWRIEAARLVGGLAKFTRDVGLAEELAQDALVRALSDWPEKGIPANPGAWLMQTAKRRAIDHFRRSRVLARKLPGMTYEAELDQDGEADPDAVLDDDVKDNVLSLIFTACHPVLGAEARTALTLRMVGGLSTVEIARAFLTAEATMQQRIVRAKKALAEAHVPFEVPRGPERQERLASVLEVIYLIFNEGYSATAGDQWLRAELAEEALRLGRVLAGLVPDDAEVHGLVALMEIQSSRNAARTAADGAPILLLEQDRTKWNRLAIGRGLAALGRAVSLEQGAGPYLVQAAIAACHARAAKAADTDWREIARLYDVLADGFPSPVVELNRAVAHGMAYGPAAGLDLLAPLADHPAMKSYHLLPSVRGDLLHKLGREDEARAEFRNAAALAQNSREKALLERRAAGAA